MYFKPTLRIAVAMCFCTVSVTAATLDKAPKPAVADKVVDRYEPVRFDRTKIGGLFGERMAVNLRERLLRDVDEDALLAGFRKRPGSHPWIGEHIGKFLHAACNTWAYSGDDALKAKIDRMARGLIATQEEDGYLGTYAPGKRFGKYPGADWDVWVHKYCLIGLLSVYRMTGYAPALESARRVGDLLCKTFGDEPGKKDIIAAGTHVGMAATSVLEPMAMLYRYTGEQRYLDFCRYITRAYDQPNGPKIISTLLEKKDVHQTANGKAYEMLSNLVGLCDLYRLTGERRFVEPALIAWKDIVKNRLYITGTSSSGEHFQEAHALAAGPGAHVGETCVTVTWIQLNLQLLRLFGEVRFADELERTVYNHLLGAQQPAEGHFCYFTPLFGKKPYQGRRRISCCQSSGPRGVSLIPAMVWGRRGDGVVVWFYTPGRAEIALPGGNKVRLVSDTDFPQSGRVSLTVQPAQSAEFPIFLRVPGWCASFKASLAGSRYVGRRGRLLEVRRTWKAGDRIEIDMDMTVQLLPGGPSYPDSVAIQRGPQVLAVDQALNPSIRSVHLAAPVTTDAAKLVLRKAAVSNLPEGWKGDTLFETDAWVPDRKGPRKISLRLVPFSDAGQQGESFTVWMPSTVERIAAAGALTAFGRESCSRDGNVDGSICDGQFNTFRVTFNGQPAAQDWYAVEWEEPAEVVRVVYAHGKNFHDGGWFDTSGGKPEIQIRRGPDSPWETVATLDSYPQTDAAKPPLLREGQRFEVHLERPVRAIAVRIVGKPSSGDNPRQAFSSCAELEAFSSEK